MSQEPKVLLPVLIEYVALNDEVGITVFSDDIVKADITNVVPSLFMDRIQTLVEQDIYEYHVAAAEHLADGRADR